MQQELQSTCVAPSSPINCSMLEGRGERNSHPGLGWVGLAVCHVCDDVRVVRVWFVLAHACLADEVSPNVVDTLSTTAHISYLVYSYDITWYCT